MWHPDLPNGFDMTVHDAMKCVLQRVTRDKSWAKFPTSKEKVKDHLPGRQAAIAIDRWSKITDSQEMLTIELSSLLTSQLPVGLGRRREETASEPGCRFEKPFAFNSLELLADHREQTCYNSVDFYSTESHRMQSACYPRVYFPSLAKHISHCCFYSQRHSIKAENTSI